MKISIPEKFTVIFSEEGKGVRKLFLAKCIEYNLCVQGRTIEQAKARFKDAVWSHVGIALHCGKIPFECIARNSATGAAECLMEGQTILTLDIKKL